ncbi:MAG: hypothetical protein ACI4XH_06815 [Acutalibacteraceae bacterium]
MKKSICVLLAIVLIIAFAANVSAAGKAVVYSDEIYTSLNEEFIVPIKLKSNTGLMGFKITVKYPDSQITLKNISSGSLTESGLFNTTVTDYYSVKGSFDVVWSSTQNITDDGTLFMLTFETVGYADYGKYKIELSYSQDDTFDEKWNDVQLDCQPVGVNILDSKSASKKNEANEPKPSVPTSPGEKVSDDYLISSVKSILTSYGITDISDVTDETQKMNIVKFVNSRNQAYSQNAIQYGSFDELKAAYTKAITDYAVKNVLESVDGEKVIALSDKILKNYSASSFSELTDENKSKAIDEALASIASNGGDTRDFASVTDDDTAAGILDGIVDGALSEQKNSVKVGSKQGLESWKIAVIIVAGVLITATVISVVLIYKKKKSAITNEEDNKNEK